MRNGKLVSMALMLLMAMVLFAVAFPLIAHAAHNFEFRFVEPTQRVDGTPFNAASVLLWREG